MPAQQELVLTSAGREILPAQQGPLVLEHPVTRARLNLTAPLPEHMQRTWETFQWSTSEVPDDPFEDLE